MANTRRLGFGVARGVLALSGLLALAACGKRDEKPARSATHLPRAEAMSVLGRFGDRFLYEDTLTDAEVGALGYDLRKLESLEIAEPQAKNRTQATLDEAYATLFSGSRTNPFAFLNERLKVFHSSTTKITNQPVEKDLIAQNWSVQVWVANMMEARHRKKSPGAIPPWMAGSRAIDMNSTRSGLIQFAPLYSTMEESVARIGVLIHEARHSDCAEGMTAAQLDRIAAAGKDITTTTYQAAVGNCGYLHPPCPEGHPLDGLLACESGDGWGAYSITLPYYRMIQSRCTNCSEADRQDALAALADAASRVLKLDALADGDLGMPDLRQQGYRN